MPVKKAEPKIIDIKPIDIKRVSFTIKGISSLIVHNWSQKALQQMLDAQKGVNKAKAKRTVKIPMNDFMGSLYWLTKQPEDGASDEEAEDIWNNAIASGAKFGFPADGIKKAIVSGAYRAGLNVTMVELRGVMFLFGNTEASTESLAEIISPNPPQVREDYVRVGGKSADIRYRAEFFDWSIPMVLEYHEGGKCSVDQLLNLVDYGGRYCGIGDWRPEKDGQHGMFQLER